MSIIIRCVPTMIRPGPTGRHDGTLLDAGGHGPGQGGAMLVTVKITLFLLWLNLLPPLAQLLFGQRFGWRVDGGLCLFDRQPLFGQHKTVRGVLASIVGGAALSFLFDLPWWLGGLAGAAAMLGDLLSSFVKRRLRRPEGSSVFGLDQFFEAFFPLMLLRSYGLVGWWHVFPALLVFVAIAYLGACFWQYISFHPDPQNYPRRVRSTVRYREWRSCHEPLARWQTVFNLTSFLADQVLLTLFFKGSGLYGPGKANALVPRVEAQEVWLADLPAAFDGFELLLLTDLHLDGLEDLTDAMISLLQETEVDLCLVGGDIRMKTYGPIAPCLRHLRRLMPAVRARSGVFGVLGNHDCLEMTPDFEEAGIVMLINDAMPIASGPATIWLVGVDDPHYYRTHDLDLAFQDVPAGACVIFVAHSPEAYQEAADHGASLYLCGHTHGGQICLPGSGPLITNSRAPRFTAAGQWQWQGMVGYTSRGVGVSGVPLRFNCPGEITRLTLRKSTKAGSLA